ncbi:MAG: hypothetical protein A3F68_04785 [Acidobacteria bacterium RIFCSPLOWO2_12_FULL_54_10]|nr:MAG: hypothetical protein A3F68_04785 [Acidobacteria bacterium RIFCSPLOWO2_12_FULL_54_10]
MNVGAPEPVIQFENVTLSFGDKPALENISFSLDRGETMILLGATGSGKSVLLKLAMGLLAPDSGKIFVLGQDISHMRDLDLFAVRQKIGMVFQEGALFDSLKVGENVGYVFERMPEVNAAEAERRVLEALRFVGLEHTVGLFPSELSGGMRRRVAIARAIVAQPELMLYDSPTAGLDPITAKRIMTLIVKQRDLRQVSSLLVTHRVQDAWKLALSYYDPQQDKLVTMSRNGDSKTSFLVLREGEIAFVGSLSELAGHTDSYVKKFVT